MPKQIALCKTIFVLVCFWAAIMSVEARPVIFNWSNFTRPSSLVSLQGHDFGSSASVVCSINGGTPHPLTVVNCGNNTVHARLPASQGLFGLRVKNGSELSDTVYVNRARPVLFDNTEVAPGGLLRVFGRNLFIKGCKPKVQFVSGKSIFAATVKSTYASGSFNVLTVFIPAQMAGGLYTVRLSNGLANWALSAVAAEEKITVRCKGPDTFKLGVPWAGDLTFGANIYNVKTDPRLICHAVGDGEHNDQSAIQNAINTAATAGGGTIYLPGGDYRLQGADGPLLDLKNKVVIRGAGRNQSVISFGYGKSGKHSCLAAFSDVSLSGLTSLSIRNVCRDNSWKEAPSITSSGKCNRIFLADLDADLQISKRIEFTGDRILVKDCRLTSTYTLLFMADSSNALVFNNKLKQRLGVHLDLTTSHNCLVENNLFELDNTTEPVNKDNVRHGLAIAFADNLAVINNRWIDSGEHGPFHNDGESILSEGGAGDRRGEEIGSVAYAGGNLLKTNKLTAYCKGTALAIINGKGTGQWRNIVARQNDQILLDRPWSVNPDRTSTYAIFVWSNKNTIIANNRFEGWRRGLWFYQASTVDSQITANNFVKMDGIFIEACQNAVRGGGQFNPVWGLLIDHNNLSSGETAAHINLTGDLQQTERLLGTMSLNNQILDNKLSGNGAKLFENDPPWTEGFCNYLRVEASHFDEGAKENKPAPPAMLGSIFENNSAFNCGAQAYLINGGAYQTTIAGDVHAGCSFVEDTNKYCNTPGNHSSIGTVILAR